MSNHVLKARGPSLIWLSGQKYTNGQEHIVQTGNMDFNVHRKYQGGLLTHAIKTHASGLHMKYHMTLQVEESSEITRFPSGI